MAVGGVGFRSTSLLVSDSSSSIFEGRDSEK